MALVNKSVLVGHSAQQMFDLVDQVEHYPEFLPWCGGSEIKSREGDEMVAAIHIDYMHIKQSFSTRNINTPPNLIQMQLLDGPFKQLDGEWRFKVLNEEACKIEFVLHYEFSSKLLDTVLGPVFSYIANSFVEAFIQRAEKVYGAS
ncbi:type II toxin-antitoxin system RatA family toxin [Sulfuriferula nivalis]|uniref:Ubiquinone-binding protein n=1 Tax=Sulfuriferula nivalis TaxID=2675298 RepID=A0A809SH32_9PROT|nr:type II toxin-antitoxin system RatA family toxin [Sulfuriferula nivalis]BBP00450.1 ubiquinone-binding protein [Sulfuriferula nivalis]